MTYQEWLKEINELLEELTGLSLDDIPDVSYMMYYEDGCSPEDMMEIIQEEGGF